MLHCAYHELSLYKKPLPKLYFKDDLRENVEL
jgi:hypothetical protein